MIVLLKASGSYLGASSGLESALSGGGIGECNIAKVNHIGFAEEREHKHSLAHTIMSVTELMRHDEQMKLFYRYHRHFKQLLVKLYKKYGAKSAAAAAAAAAASSSDHVPMPRHNDPGIAYALNHLMRVLYIKSSTSTSASNSNNNNNSAPSSSAIQQHQHQQQQQQQQAHNKQHNVHRIASAGRLSSMDAEQQQQQQSNVEWMATRRVCSNPSCENEETKFKPFKECGDCGGRAAYCNGTCLRAHIAYHRKYECGFAPVHANIININNNNNNNYGLPPPVRNWADFLLILKTFNFMFTSGKASKTVSNDFSHLIDKTFSSISEIIVFYFVSHVFQ